MQCVAVIIQLVSQDHVCRFENADQSRAEENNTDVLERKDSMAKCYQRAWERACVTSPLFGQGILHHFFFSYGYICMYANNAPNNLARCIN
jgi:hypothetical protein